MSTLISKYKYTITFLITLLPYIFLSQFTNPFAEDFGFATQAQKKETLELLKVTYQGMNGRYIANVFMYYSPIAFNSFLGYKLSPIVLILLTIFSFFRLFKALFSFWDSDILCAIAVASTALFLNGLPIISEGLYWYTGASIYCLGTITSLLAFSSLINLLNGKPTFPKHIYTGLMLILSCGFNETQTAINLFVILLILISHFQRKTNKHKTIFIPFFITCAAAALMYLAPGNQNRATMYTNETHDLIHSISFSLAQLGRFLLDWSISLPLLFTTLLFIGNHNWLKKKSKLIYEGFFLNKWIAIALLCIPILIAVFPSYWFTGILGQHRTLNAAYSVYLIGWFVLLSTWMKGSALLQKLAQRIQLKNTLFILFLVFGCLFSDNGYHALSDLFSGKAHAFNRQMEYRHELLSKTTNLTGIELRLDPITAKPKCLFVDDIQSDPSFWMNLGYNHYYRLDKVPIYLKP